MGSRMESRISMRERLLPFLGNGKERRGNMTLMCFYAWFVGIIDWKTATWEE